MADSTVKTIESINSIVNNSVLAPLMGFNSLRASSDSTFFGDQWEFATAYAMPNTLARYEFERNQYREKSGQTIYIQATVYPNKGDLQSFVIVKFDTKRHRIELFNTKKQQELGSQKLVLNATEKQLNEVARSVKIVRVNQPCEDRLNYGTDVPHQILERSRSDRQVAENDDVLTEPAFDRMRDRIAVNPFGIGLTSSVSEGTTITESDFQREYDVTAQWVAVDPRQERSLDEQDENPF